MPRLFVNAFDHAVPYVCRNNQRAVFARRSRTPEPIYIGPSAVNIPGQAAEGGGFLMGIPEAIVQDEKPRGLERGKPLHPLYP